MQDDRSKERAVKFKACVWLNSLSLLCECHIYSLTHLFFTPFVLMMLTVALVTILVCLQLCSCCCYFYCNNIIIISVRRLIIIIIIIISVITFLQGLCNYVPETNHVSRIYSVAAVL